VVFVWAVWLKSMKDLTHLPDNSLDLKLKNFLIYRSHSSPLVETYDLVGPIVYKLLIKYNLIQNETTSPHPSYNNSTCYKVFLNEKGVNWRNYFKLQAAMEFSEHSVNTG